MKKVVLSIKICLFTICLTSNVIGQYSIKVGENYSSFKEENTQWKVGPVLGVGLEKGFYKEFSLAGEIHLIKKKGFIKELPVYFDGIRGVNTYDIKASIYYMEIPLILKYKIPLYKKIKLKLFVGPSLSIALFDKSSLFNEKFLFYFDANRDDPADYPINPTKYSLGMESSFGLNNLNYGCLFGSGIMWDRFSIEIRYRKDRLSIGPVSTLTEIDKQLHTFYLLLGIEF